MRGPPAGRGAGVIGPWGRAMGVLDVMARLLDESGFGQFHWTNGVMIGVGLLFIWLAIKKGFEPLLLVPIGFGIIVGNIPYDATKVPVSVYDGPVGEADLAVYGFEDAVFTWREGMAPEAEAGLQAAESHEEFMRRVVRSERVALPGLRKVEDRDEADRLLRSGRAVLVNVHQFLTPRLTIEGPGLYRNGQGRWVVEGAGSQGSRRPELWSLDRQEVRNASVLWWLFAGVGLAGFYPPLIFLGIGAMTDFGPLLANPKLILLGAAAQFGIFGSLVMALLCGFVPGFEGFTLKQAASIAIIGGADGPTAIFTCTRLAPELLGAVALAAYSYMALVPLILPPVIRAFTTKRERLIRMEQARPVSKGVRIVFPIVGFIFTAFISPAGLPLLGMLFFGNLLRESLVTDRLAKTAQNQFIDIVTILLGLTVGAKTSAANFLTPQTIFVFILGVIAFSFGAMGGVLCAKLMNLVSRSPVNPMIGAAGVSAVPMSARVVHKMGLEEDPQNYLMMHAMGPNVAGVIGSAVAAGVLLSRLSGT